MQATYTKLRDGSWGVRVPGSVAAGAAVIVAKKSGETKSETVERVLWSGEGVTLCSIRQSAAPRRSGYGGSGYGNRAPGGRKCDYCGSRECSRAWNPRDLCDED